MMRTTLSAAVLTVLSVVILLLFPVLHLGIIILNFAIHFCVLGFQWIGAYLPRVKVLRKKPLRRNTFISIHVPAHNEPPALLKETLRALSQLDWPNYEVLVVDNNTTDPELWKPIEAYCQELGPRFRFFHVENLRGFKAGALNYVRNFMDPRAEFIFVIDADYVVDPSCLQSALSYDTDPSVALVQFPQDYRNITAGNLGMALDFKHFFAGYMNLANRFQCVPSTGTLSLIRVSALKAIGGFDTDVITEDAELGFRLNARGYRCVYAHETVGKGLMPHDLEDLKKQRWRWAFGNAQILKTRWSQIFWRKGLSFGQRLGFVVHLSSWFNFNLLPTFSLLLLTPLALMDKISPAQHYVVVISGLTLLTFLALRFGTIYFSLKNEKHSFIEICHAFLSHVGLGWIYCASWLKCLWDHRFPFVRTNKFINKNVPGFLRATFIELSLSAGLTVAFTILGMTGFILGPIAALAMTAAWLGIVWVWKQTQHTYKVTAEMLSYLERLVPADTTATTALPRENITEERVA